MSLYVCMCHYFMYFATLCICIYHYYMSISSLYICTCHYYISVCVSVIVRLSSNYAAHVSRPYSGPGNGSHSQEISYENLNMKFEVNMARILESCSSRTWHSAIGCIIINDFPRRR